MGWLWFVQKRFVKYVDGAIFVVEGVEGHVSFVLFICLKCLYGGNFRVKSAIDSGITVSLPFVV